MIPFDKDPPSLLLGTVAILTHPNLILWCVGSFRWQGRDTCTSLCAIQRLCFPWHSLTISDLSWRQTWSGRSTRRTQCHCHTLTRAWHTCRKRPTATLTPTARATFINVSWFPKPNCTPITIITRVEKNSSIPFFPFDVHVLLQDGECTLWTGTDNVWTCVMVWLFFVWLCFYSRWGFFLSMPHCYETRLKGQWSCMNMVNERSKFFWPSQRFQ